MGECINENTYRDWQSDPKKLVDPIKPIEVSYAHVETVERVVSWDTGGGLAKQFILVLALRW